MAKVADFGLSRKLKHQQTATRTVGTVTHMPPELLMQGTWEGYIIDCGVELQGLVCVSCAYLFYKSVVKDAYRTAIRLFDIIGC